MELPDAYVWWPKLSIAAKHRLLEEPGASIPDSVLREIEEIVGEEMRTAARLTQDDVQFIRTQREPVD